MSKPEEYGICIRLIRQDDVDLYEGRVAELPDLKVYCETFSEAYEELVDAIHTALQLFAEQGRPFPQAEPSEEHFSGRITLRMSKSLHRCAHERALRDAVSLNQWIVEAVACRVTPAPAPVSHAAFYVMSPMRQSNIAPVGACIQQAAVVHTLETPSGIFSVLMTPGIVEAGSVSRAENNLRQIV